MAKLALTLHQRYGRREAFAAVGVEYDQRKPHFNVGLSPQCPDGGYSIFITLNKERLDPAYDYDDELFADRFRWVTRRDRGSDHPDYLRLRDPTTRVSLFVRNNSGERFAYLGELKYRTHREFYSSDNRVQQEYVFRLEESVPDQLLSELTQGLPKRVERNGPSERVSDGGEAWRRRPSSLDDYKKAFSYAVGELDRTVMPGHYNYQVRLMNFLKQKGVSGEFEKDLIDVSFSLDGLKFIGEIKVTVWLRLEQAFRMALGQLLEYEHLRCPAPVGLIMFLDQELDAPRLALASRLAISVVFERDENYALQNPQISEPLAVLFSEPSEAQGSSRS